MKKLLLSSLVLLTLGTACAPAFTPVPTAPPATDTISPAVITVDMFYTFVNEAQSPEELGLPWNMLTLDEQCNPRDKCELTNFTNTWWESKALYKLYSCDTNIVVVEEMRYSRDANRPIAMIDSRYWTFELVDNGGLLLISKRYTVNALGDECVLAIDRVVNP
jgi:hypothetical protein